MESEMNEEVYLKETRKAVGEIEPIIMNRKGLIADGRHRKKAVPNWKVDVRDLTEEQVHQIRLVKNTQRRRATEADYNEYAAFLQATSPGKDAWHVASGETITERISEKTGIPEHTVRAKLAEEFKGPQKAAVSATSLGTGKQVRIPAMIAEDVDAYSEEIRRTAGKNPKIKSAIIRHAKTDLKRLRSDLVEASKMHPFLSDMVATGKLSLEVAQLIKNRVPHRFRETEAAFIAQKKMKIQDAEGYIISQRVLYLAHKTEKETHSISEKKDDEYLPSPVSVKKLEIDGTVTATGETVKINVDSSSIPFPDITHVPFPDITHEVNDALAAIQKQAQVGDMLNITINLLTRIKRKKLAQPAV